MSAVAEVLPGAAPRLAAAGVDARDRGSRAGDLSADRAGFLAFQIGAQSLFLGVISLSLMFLGGYGGMVSLAQMTIAGVAGYLIAIVGGKQA